MVFKNGIFGGMITGFETYPLEYPTIGGEFVIHNWLSPTTNRFFPSGAGTRIGYCFIVCPD